MRLIDADRVLLNEDERILGYTDINAALKLQMVKIVNAPTVDAIPVEFIKRFATFSPPTPTYIYGEESIDMDAWCEELFEQWKKENEK